MIYVIALSKLCPHHRLSAVGGNGSTLSDDESESVSRETSPCSESPQPAVVLHDNDTSTTSPPPPSTTSPASEHQMTTGTSMEESSSSSSINAAQPLPEGVSSTDLVVSSQSTTTTLTAGDLPEQQQVEKPINNSLAHQLNMRIKSKASTVRKREKGREWFSIGPPTGELQTFWIVRLPRRLF